VSCNGRNKQHRTVQRLTVWRKETYSKYRLVPAVSPFMGQQRHHYSHVLRWSKGYPQRNSALWASIFFAHKKRTTPRCSIVVHVLRGAAIL
jgi:hypothetical protein